ncbi:hypothetical protein [Deinococcus wulumuqiensis]|uniref:hypothetical protein n=1 Tax=Deinococcus wulumuqiensis TaxID=980427 RepID=UPI00242B9E38|nr:hypothetical protein [Deinococcus wulumuqiensis]
MIAWVDLLIEGDSHPRRFDSYATLRAYVLKLERLSEDAADELMVAGVVRPPLARREYRIQRLPLPDVNGAD